MQALYHFYYGGSSSLSFSIYRQMIIGTSLPGAIGMYGLSLGVSRIGDTLPLPVYGLLSGLNSATVGIIALAAMQLAQMTVTDRLTRALVAIGGAAGMLYTALWYFPVLMIAAGGATVISDFRLIQRLYAYVLRKERPIEPKNNRISVFEIQAGLNSLRSLNEDDVQRFILTRNIFLRDIEAGARDPQEDAFETLTVRSSGIELNVLTWKIGILIIGLFLLSFAGVMVLRVFLAGPPRAIGLFQNLYLAGTIIFGGGPVAIPLLKEYIVEEGWVTQRDFLIGLALIQAFPGPNFNLAVYLGSLATAGTSVPSFVGALIAYFAIFLPGLMVVTGIMGLWKVLRSKKWLRSFLRGINAGAVGLVFTAVFKLWNIGEVEPAHSGGQPLSVDAWWVAITATAFVCCCWFGLRAPFAILLGGIMGLCWFGAVGHWPPAASCPAN
jgi:chromate transport protein ChrA